MHFKYLLKYLTIVFYLIYIQEVSGFFKVINDAYYNYIQCRNECCDEHFIVQNITKLNSALKSKLFGQHIAHESVVNALRAHVNDKNSPKALAMSFHGPGGTGKNYVANMIVNSFYKKQKDSQYVHVFLGRVEFSLESKVNEYKEQLKNIVVESLLQCPKSLFIFDEVDMIVPGVLNVLVPFLDYGTSAHVWFRGYKVQVITNQAIFIFLSNTGAQKIVNKLLDFWIKGDTSRTDARLSHFEDLISLGAFNEHGGFHKSDTIQTNLIDHYVPFLPLEKEHVILCIKEAFAQRGKRNPSSRQIDEIMEHVTFGPSTHLIYAKSGCKRIETKVSSSVYRHKSHSNEL